MKGYNEYYIASWNDTKHGTIENYIASTREDAYCVACYMLVSNECDAVYIVNDNSEVLNKLEKEKVEKSKREDRMLKVMYERFEGMDSMELVEASSNIYDLIYKFEKDVLCRGLKPTQEQFETYEYRHKLLAKTQRLICKKMMDSEKNTKTKLCQGQTIKHD